MLCRIAARAARALPGGTACLDVHVWPSWRNSLATLFHAQRTALQGVDTVPNQASKLEKSFGLTHATAFDVRMQCNNRTTNTTPACADGADALLPSGYSSRQV